MYKLTDQKLQTHNGYQWVIGEWHEAPGDINQPLCTNGWLHCYSNPLLAVLLNPVHAVIINPRMFVAETYGEHKSDNGLKEGFRRMRLVREMTVPDITNTQKIAFGILCAKRVYKNNGWNRWAVNWLRGKDRSKVAANRAANAAYVAYDIVYGATHGTLTDDTEVSDTAANVAYAAYNAALGIKTLVADNHVAYAATRAAATIPGLDLIRLAKQAMKY